LDWYDITDEYHGRTLAHEGELSSLAADWQRELAALWRLEADVNNGAYLQFLANWGRECYVIASRALHKIGAKKMAQIIDQCQALVDEHFPCEGKSQDELEVLLTGIFIDLDGTRTERKDSPLPDTVVARIYELSYEFMDYPDDIAELGLPHYRPLVERDRTAR